MSAKIAVVTGANKGIGYAIVRALCKRAVGVVYLTSRNVVRGHEAIEKLKKEDVTVLYHQLDVSDKNSVKEFAELVKIKHGGIDILINNAGVRPREFDNYMCYEDAKYVIDVNYYSHFNIMEYLFPILKDNARVINMVSELGHITNLKNQFWINRLIRSDIKVDDVKDFLDWYLNCVKNNNLNVDDFFSTTILSYRISKIALCALTKIQQRIADRGISLNSLHPGFVQTDMTNNLGRLTSEQASEAVIYLALDCSQSLKGKYIWFDKTEKEWENTNPKYIFPYAKEQSDKVIKMFYGNM